MFRTVAIGSEMFRAGCSELFRAVPRCSGVPGFTKILYLGDDETLIKKMVFLLFKISSKE